LSKIVSKYIECYVYKKFPGGIKFLILKRSPKKEPYPNIWQIITGRIEKKEKAYETAIRELKEETGLTPVNMFNLPFVTQFYIGKSDELHLIPLFLAEVDEDKIRISEEHTEYLWLDYKSAYNKIYWLDQKENFKKIKKILKDKELFNILVQIK
jgi:dATP pyrophosphohydrolase